MKRLPSFPSKAIAVVALNLLAGCVGEVGKSGVVGPKGGGGSTVGTGGGNGTGNGNGTGTGGGPGGPGSGGTIGAGGAGSPGDPLAAGVKPLRLLSAREYLNTVRDLLADTTLQAPALPDGDEDPQATPSFAFQLPHAVATQDGTLLQSAAETLARNAVAHLTTLLPCASPTLTGAAATTCLNTFLTTFMPKMYRRPLTAAEASTTAAAPGPLAKLFALGTSTLALGFNDAIGLLIEASLQSPQFLYHWEVDPKTVVTPAGAVVKLGNYELASRLSYFLWGTMPDAALFTAAAAGTLGDAATLDTQVRRMLKDPKANDMFLNFFTDWLDIDTLSDIPKDQTMYSMYNDALTSAMTTELQSFVTGIMNGTGKFADLMTGTNTSANQVLAAFYGVTGVTNTAISTSSLATCRGNLAGAVFRRCIRKGP